MTDGDLHLDDDTISAALDGDAIGDASRVHLDECATCRARLDAFRRVATTVGTPVPPPSAVARDAAIAAALAASIAGGRDTVEPRRRNVGPWLAAAAVILALLVAVPLIGALSSGRDTNDAATSSGRDNASSKAAASPVVDLGALDAANLAATVGERVGASPSPLSAAAPGQGDTSAQRSAGTTSGGAATEEGAGGAAGGAAGESLAADAGRACESTLHASGRQVLVARGTWGDRPAVVFAYRAGDDVSAYVVNPPDCRILHFVRFRAGS